MKRTNALLVACLALLIFVTVVTWVARHRASWRANEKFAEDLLASARSDTPLHREVLPLEERTALAERRHLLGVKARRVFVDETWGGMEFGYCFSNGAYAYITFLTAGEPPKPASLAVYEPRTTYAEQCGSP